MNHHPKCICKACEAIRFGYSGTLDQIANQMAGDKRNPAKPPVIGIPAKRG